MLRLFAVDHDHPPEPDPPGLLPRLARLGVRFFDSRRWLLVEVPGKALDDDDWPELEAALRRHSAVLQVLAGEVQSAMDEISPEQLRERILDLPARSLPTLITTLGGFGTMFDYTIFAGEFDESEQQRAPDSGSRGAGDRSVEDDPARLELCYAAFLRALREEAISPTEDD